MYKDINVQKILKIFYLNWPIVLPYKMNSGSTYESSYKVVFSVSSLFWEFE